MLLAPLLGALAGCAMPFSLAQAGFDILELQWMAPAALLSGGVAMLVSFRCVELIWPQLFGLKTLVRRALVFAVYSPLLYVVLNLVVLSWILLGVGGALDNA
jgi:hypothetical protein